MDNYRVLGLSPDATDEDIRKKWKKLALKYHPDKNPDLRAEEKFKEISQAYQTITKEQKKQAKEGEDAAHAWAKMDKKPQRAKAKKSEMNKPKKVNAKASKASKAISQDEAMAEAMRETMAEALTVALLEAITKAEDREKANRKTALFILEVSFFGSLYLVLLYTL